MYLPSSCLLERYKFDQSFLARTLSRSLESTPLNLTPPPPHITSAAIAPATRAASKPSWASHPILWAVAIRIQDSLKKGTRDDLIPEVPRPLTQTSQPDRS